MSSVLCVSSCGGDWVITGCLVCLSRCQQLKVSTKCVVFYRRAASPAVQTLILHMPSLVTTAEEESFNNHRWLLRLWLHLIIMRRCQWLTDRLNPFSVFSVLKAPTNTQQRPSWSLAKQSIAKEEQRLHTQEPCSLVLLCVTGRKVAPLWIIKTELLVKTGALCCVQVSCLKQEVWKY